MALDFIAMSDLMDAAARTITGTVTAEQAAQKLCELVAQRVTDVSLAYLLITEFRNAACGERNLGNLQKITEHDPLEKMRAVIVETLINAWKPAYPDLLPED